MRKIKFKTEYVPLSDDVINQHKDFNTLMAAFVAAPKPNFFKRFIQNKWTMFGGGLMTGAIVTSLLWLNYNVSTITEPVSKILTIQVPGSPAKDKNSVPMADSFNTEKQSTHRSSPQQDAEDLTDIKDAETADAEKRNSIAKISSESTITSSKNSFSNSAVKNQLADKSEKMSGIQSDNQESASVKKNNYTDQHADDILLSNETKTTHETSEIVSSVEQDVSSENIPGKETSEVKSGDENKTFESQQPSLASDIADDSADAIIIGNENKKELNDLKNSSASEEDSSTVYQNSRSLKSTGNDSMVTPASNYPDKIIASDDSKDSSVQSAAKLKKVNAEKIKVENKMDERSAAIDDSSNGFLNFKWHLFKRDSIQHDVAKPEKRGLFAFKRDSSAAKSIAEEKAANDSMFKPRYAQVSFITPLSSNGIDGYKYMHNISLNVLQGYNGALKGVEFGGLLNGDKGYVTGAQFAGLGNYAGGNMKGAQFGGLANVAKSVRGAQVAGIANVSTGYTIGFQAAGITNFSADSLNGFQAAGIINMISSLKKSKSWQVAGIGNISLAQSSGGQVAGVFNVADQLDGGQIGIINIGKNIKGFQIGLINISDTISGVPIGLISISRHGIFDVNVWTSDVFTFNGGVRVGSKYVYNIYAYGASPFKSDLPFGFGIGIGGHIPIRNAFLDMDVMAWSVHRSYFSFFGVNMINQFRLMGGYTFNKYFSVFAGPTFNVGVQDSRYDTFHEGTIYEHNGQNTTEYLYPGFVAGVRLF